MRLREWPGLSAVELAAFFENWPGAGEYIDGTPSAGQFNARQIAREWLKNKNLRPYTDGSAFGDVTAFEETEGQSVEKPNKGLRFNVETLEDLEREGEPVSWLIKGYIERGVTGAVFGAPGEGKTAALIDMGLKLAHGIAWQGRKTTKTGVLYVIQEGRAGARRRARAWAYRMRKAGIEVDQGAWLMIREPIDLYNGDKDAKGIAEAAHSFEEKFGFKCGLIVVDTLSQAMPGGDENSSRDVGVVTKRLDRIRDKTGASVFVVHHTGKDATRGARGSTAILGNVDVCIAIINRTFTTTAQGTKLREGDPNQRYSFDLETVVAGVDEDGEPVTTVVAVERARAVMPAVQEDADPPELTPLDGPADKIEATLAALRTCAERHASYTGDAVESIGIGARDIFKQLNTDRKNADLSLIQDRTAAPRMLAKLVARGDVKVEGANRRTLYRLVNRLAL